MIELKDLRLYNKVSDKNGFQMHVVGFLYGEAYLDFDGNEGGLWEVKEQDLYPIKITEELLVSLGAVKLNFKNFPSYNLKGLQLNFIDGMWIEYVNRLEIDGLHKLQNVYYYRILNELPI